MPAETVLAIAEYWGVLTGELDHHTVSYGGGVSFPDVDMVAS